MSISKAKIFILYQREVRKWRVNLKRSAGSKSNSNKHDFLGIHTILHLSRISCQL